MTNRETAILVRLLDGLGQSKATRTRIVDGLVADGYSKEEIAAVLQKELDRLFSKSEVIRIFHASLRSES